MRLTVGVVARNGLPHLRHCLSSLPALADCAAEVEFTLVDSASSDGTLEAMLAFAQGRLDTRGYAMQARSTRLRRVTSSCVMPNLVPCSWSMATSPLPATSSLPSWPNSRRTAVRSSMADCRRPEVLEAGIIYDEAQRRSHDLELGVRLAERFRILALPIVMGTHYTVSYYAPRRVGGLLSGHALGLCLQLLLIAALLFQSSWLTAFAAGLLALDIARFAWQGRLRDYIPELSRPGSS